MENIIERAISPYNVGAKVVNEDRFAVYAPAAGNGKIGMAGYNPAQFKVRNQIVSLNERFTDIIVNEIDVGPHASIPAEIRYDGVDGIKTPNTLYYNYTNKVISAIPENGELTYETMTGTLIVTATTITDITYQLTELFIAGGHIALRTITVSDDTVIDISDFKTVEISANEDLVEKICIRLDEKLDRIILDKNGNGADPGNPGSTYDNIGTHTGVYVEHMGSDGEWRPMLRRANNASMPGGFSDNSDPALKEAYNKYKENLSVSRIPITNSNGTLHVVAPDGTIYEPLISIDKISTINRKNAAIPLHYADDHYVGKMAGFDAPEGTVDNEKAYTMLGSGKIQNRYVTRSKTPGLASIPIRDKSSQTFHIGDPTKTTQPVTSNYMKDNLRIEMDSSNYTLRLKYKNPETKKFETFGDPIDLPLESMVIDAEYFEDAKILKLTLNNGKTLEIPASDITYEAISPLVYTGDVFEGHFLDQVLEEEFLVNCDDFNRFPMRGDWFFGIAHDEYDIPYYYTASIKSVDYDAIPPDALFTVHDAYHFEHAVTADALTVSLEGPLLLPGTIKDYINEDHPDGIDNVISLSHGDFTSNFVPESAIGKKFFGAGKFDDDIVFHFVATVEDVVKSVTCRIDYIIPTTYVLFADSSSVSERAIRDGDDNVISSTYAKIDDLENGNITVDKANKATCDGKGFDISGTYVKKVDLESGSFVPKRSTNADSATRLKSDWTSVTPDEEGRLVLPVSVASGATFLIMVRPVDTSTGAMLGVSETDIVTIYSTDVGFVNRSVGTIAVKYPDGYASHHKWTITKESDGKFTLSSYFREFLEGNISIKHII